MTALRHGLAVLLLLASGAGGAMAEGEGGSSLPAFPENGTVYIVKSGTPAMKTLPEASVAMLLREGAMPLEPGTMVTMHAGRLYLVKDHAMPDGHQLSDLTFFRGGAGR